MKLLFGTFGESISFLNVVCRIGIALVIGGAIGYEREKRSRQAGLKTHILVCLAATIIGIVEQQLTYEVSTLGSVSVSISFGRTLVGVITGIGFIGSGAIMMSKSKTAGLTTAASLFCTACIGIVNGIGYCLVALFVAAIVIIILSIVVTRERKEICCVINIDFKDATSLPKLVDDYLTTNARRVINSSFSFSLENDENKCSSRYTILVNNKDEMAKIITELYKFENVNLVKIETME